MSAVLKSLAAHGSGATLKDIASDTGLPASSTHRMLSSLINVGFVEQVARGTYRLGLGIWAIGVRAMGHTELPPTVENTLRALTAETGETTHLTVLEGRDVVYVARVDSPQAVAVHRSIGDRFPAFATGSGKVILAHSSASTVDQILQGELTQLTPFTRTDPGDIRETLARIRADGYVVNVREVHLDAVSVAAPVLSHDGTAIAGLTISIPEYRATPTALEGFIAAARAAARTLSIASGAPADPEGA